MSMTSLITPIYRENGTKLYPPPPLQIVHHAELELGLPHSFDALEESSLRHLQLTSDPLFEPQPTRRMDLPAPREWASKFTQAALEVLAGKRNVAQLSRWSNRIVYVHLERRSGQLKGTPRVLKIHLCEPVDGAAEASIIFSLEKRVRAVALRLDGFDGRWLATSFIVG